MKSLKCCKNYQTVTDKHEVSTCCWKYGADRLAGRRVAKNLQFVKENAITAKRSEGGMPVLNFGEDISQ
jgi:hypothetical protein